MAGGFRYTGDWNNGMIEGEGIATYPNGDTYEGSFLAGKRHGQGVVRYAEGQSSAGEWTDNMLTGPAPTAPEDPTPPAAPTGN
jgi:hypothetical protein